MAVFLGISRPWMGDCLHSVVLHLLVLVRVRLRLLVLVRVWVLLVSELLELCCLLTFQLMQFASSAPYCK